MNEPVVRLTNLTRSFEQGGERIDVLLERAASGVDDG